MTVDTDRPRGTQRDDDLLSLDQRAVAHRLALMRMAHALSVTTLVGKPAPVVEDLWQRMRAPQPGDFVVEQTRARSPRTPLDLRIKGHGILLARRRETFVDPEDADVYPEADRTSHEDAWYVQYGPGPDDVCRWTNADFLAVPVRDEDCWW